MSLTDRLKQTGSRFLKSSKKKIIPIIISPIIAFTPPIFSGCGGGGGGSGGGTNTKNVAEQIIEKEILILNNDSIKELVSYKDGTLKFSNHNPQLDSLSIGDTIIVEPNNHAPYGLLRKINDIQEGSVILLTTSTTLEEAVKNGSVTKNELKDQVFELDLPINKNFYNGKITANGNMSLNLNINFEPTNENHKLKELLFTNSLTGRLNLELASSATIGEIDEKTSIYSQNLGTYGIMMGTIPIWVTPILKANIGVMGHIPTNFSTEITTDINSTTGLHYYNEKWETINQSSSYFEFKLNIPEINTNDSPPKVFAGIELDLLVYSVAGPHGELSAYSKLEIESDNNTCWKTYGGLEAILGVKMDILSLKVLEKLATPIEIYNELLDEGCLINKDNDNDGYDSTIDCNDNNYSINPGVSEVCGDGIDNNCSGVIDEGCNPLQYTNNLGMTFNLIPAGTFIMGSPESEIGRDDGETQHQVTLTNQFYMQTTEVTQGQWKAIMKSNPSNFPNCGDDCPVEIVSWHDTQNFITILNNMNQGTYRLPTEAEWEYSARAGTTTALPNGNITMVDKWYCVNDSIIDVMGWYCENSNNKTHPVAQKQPNAWGLYDMHGNVSEWCQDWFDGSPYQPDPVTNPTGPSDNWLKANRGGGWQSAPKFTRSADRDADGLTTEYWSLGFRLVKTAE